MRKTLIQLLADNRQVRGREARIEQKAKSNEATLYLYDMIVSSQWEAEYWGGVCAQDLVPKIDALDADVIHVRINSPGGDVFAAQTIGAALERHKAKVVAHVDGLAASAATAICMSCDEVLIAEGAMFMIHNAWTIAIGDKNDFIDVAALLEKVDSSLVSQYAEKTGKTKAAVQQLMDAETWMTAEEAVAEGFADKCEKHEEEADDAKANAPRTLWNLAAFEKAPKPTAGAPAQPPAPQPPKAEAPTEADVARRARIAALSKVPA
jgi:ATP-dependent Clp protease, protease subunit